MAIKKRFILSLMAIFIFYACGHAQNIKTIAGTGKKGSTDGPALEADLNNPFGVILDSNGTLWFCEYDGHTVRKMDSNGMITTVVGTGEAGYYGDGGPAIEAKLNKPHEIRFDDNEEYLYIADMGNHAIRRVNMSTGKIYTFAGTGKSGFSGDGGPASQADLNQPHSIQFGPQHHLYIADIGNHRLRVVDIETGTISTLAGNGEKDPTPDGANFADVPLNGPRSLDFDHNGDLWLVLREGNQVFRLSLASGRIYHMAGTGARGTAGNGADARKATLSGPKGIAVAPDGDVYIVDTESHTIRKINNQNGIIELVVGTGEAFDGKDGGPLQCGLARPHGIFVDSNGLVYIGDSENHKIRVYQP